MPADTDFDAALNLARTLAYKPEWADYVAYLELRGKGLRKPALARVRAFADAAAMWPFEERWSLTETILSQLHLFDTRDNPLPHPLVEKLIRPAVEEATTKFPTNPWPPYWLGQDGIFDWAMVAPSFDRDRFSKEALRRDANFQPALKDLVSMILRGVGYEQHELPHGYLGDPRKSLAALSEARSYIIQITNEQERHHFADWTKEDERVARQYLVFQKEGNGTYRQWCDERGLSYR